MECVRPVQQDIIDSNHMKLCIDDEDHRPQYLTDNFFINLMITQTKRKATLQILQFHKKKELTYSTKMSDGYFIVKVMVIQKAAEQLEKGEIKVNYVIEGMLRNHGEGVIMVRDALKFWKYQSKIGNPINWRLNRENVNSKGHGFIVWNSQQLYDLHAGTQQSNAQGDKRQASKSGKEEINTQKQKTQKQQQQFRQVYKEMPINTDRQQINTAKMEQKPIIKEQSFNLAALNSSLTQTQKADNEQHAKHAKVQEKQPIFDLKFVFDFFEEEDQQNEIAKTQTQQPLVEQSQQPQNQQEQDEFISNWLQSKKNRELTSSQKRREMYKLMLLDQSESDKEESHNTVTSISSKQQPLLRPMINCNNIKQQVKTDSFQITFSDIYHGLSTKSTANWWTKTIICCLGPLTQKDYANVILSDEKGYYIINAVFTNYSFLKVELLQNKVYKIGNGLIRMSGDQIHRNMSHCQLQFDCKKALISPSPSVQPVTYRAENYTTLNKLYELQDGMRINTFAVIKSIRNNEGKNGTMSHYEIIDPIIKYSIVFTQFDSHLQEQDLQTLINTPITIYNAWTSSFRGRKNIVSKSKTIIKYNWLPLLQQTDQIWRWLQDECNLLQNIDLNLVGYVECAGLDQIDSIADGRVFVKNVTVLDINDKFKYLGCIKCYKKVEDGRCRTCGKRNSKQIVERLLVRGSIGDTTNVLGVLWSNSLGQGILREGLSVFRQKWQLKKVTVWLQRGSKEGYTIVKLHQTSTKTRITQLLSYLNRNIL